MTEPVTCEQPAVPPKFSHPAQLLGGEFYLVAAHYAAGIGWGQLLVWLALGTATVAAARCD